MRRQRLAVRLKRCEAPAQPLEVLGSIDIVLDREARGAEPRVVSDALRRREYLVDTPVQRTVVEERCSRLPRPDEVIAAVRRGAQHDVGAPQRAQRLMQAGGL